MLDLKYKRKIGHKYKITSKYRVFADHKFCLVLAHKSEIVFTREEVYQQAQKGDLYVQWVSENAGELLSESVENC